MPRISEMDPSIGHGAQFAETTAIVAPDKQSLAGEAQTWSAKAKALTITNAESCTNATFLLRSIKGVRNDIQRWFEPHIEAAMETKRKAEAARKALADERDRMEAPLVEAERVVKGHLLAYEQEQERARLAEQERLQAEALRQAEATTLAAAAALEREANLTGDAGMRAEAESILEQPIEAPIVVVKPSMPKVEGVTYRDHWTADTTQIDIKALCAAVVSGAVPPTFVLANWTAIKQYARSTQGTQPVPGVRIYNDRQIAARG